MFKLLVVDDDQVIQETMCDYFRNRAYDTYGVASGEEALPIIEKERPDLVLLDVILGPGRLNGFDILTQIKEIDNTIRVIIITGQAIDNESIMRAKALGVDDYLLKPLDYETLEKKALSKIRDQLFEEFRKKAHEDDMSIDKIRFYHSICDETIVPYEIYQDHTGKEIVTKCKKYLYENSVLFKMIMDNPGDCRNTEFMYDAIPSTPLDSDLLSTGAAKGIFSRFPAVCRIVGERVYSLLNQTQHSKIKVLNVGSGPGRDTLWLSRRFPGQVTVTCVDNDPKALSLGKRMVAKTTINGYYDFVEDNMLSLNYDQEYDILLLVGVLCTIPANKSPALLRRLRRYLKPEGYIIATNVTPFMKYDDPFGDFLIRNFADWHLQYKTQEEIENILKRSRFLPVNFRTDGTKYHWIFTAKKIDDFVKSL